MIEDIQQNPPIDPYFPSLLSQPDHPGWLALARHHGFPTRLLDVTRDLFVAVYFACEDPIVEDGFIFAYIDPWNPERNNPGRVTTYVDLFDAALGDRIPAYRRAENERPGTIRDNAAILEEDYGRGRADLIYLFECNDVINERMVAQRGAFIWRGDPTRPLLDGVPNVFVIRIRSGAKQAIIQKLNVLGINRTTLRLD
jgi:hypothetical protein